MVSVASGGTADRIAARIFFNVLLPGSGTPARYSSKLPGCFGFFGVVLRFAAELRLADFAFFMRGMLKEVPLQVHALGGIVHPFEMNVCVGMRAPAQLSGFVRESESGAKAKGRYVRTGAK